VSSKPRLLIFAGNAFFALVALAIGGLILALTILPPVLGYQTYVVLSGSMEPTIHTGAVIVATAVDPNALEIGDIVTFLRPGDQESVTHRIVGIKGTAQGKTFVTRGDANGVEDQGEIRYDRLAGKVTFSIPYLGYFFKFIGSPSMRLLFIVVPGMLLLGSWLWEVWRPEPKSKQPDEQVPAGLSPALSAGPARPLTQHELGLGSAADAAAIPIRR
jgi:signal peptidase I